MTSTDRITGVSRLPSRPRSPSTLAITPEDDTQVIPASTIAACQPQPSRNAKPAPGSALSSMSISAGRCGRAQVADQLAGRVLQAEHDQQQDDADLGADLDELLARRERDQAAVPEGQPGEQVERDGREADPAADAAEHAEGEEQRADLDEQDRRTVHCGPIRVPWQPSSVVVSPARMAVTPSRPSRVPTATTTSFASKTKDGPGDAMTSRSRRTATMEALVRVRARVSPSRRPTNGEPAGRAICSVSRTGGLLPQAGELAQHQGGAEHVGERLGLVVGERDRGQAGVRVVHVVEHQVATAVAMGDHPDGTAGGGDQVMPNADPRQRSLFNPYAHGSTVTAAA